MGTVGATHTGVERGDKIIVCYCSGHDMTKEQRLILLYLTTLKMVPDECRDGLTSCGHTDMANKDWKSGEFVQKRRITHFWHINPYFMLSSDKSLTVIARLS